MQNIQDVFSRIQSKKVERRNIQTQYKDALNSSAEYKGTMEKLRGYKLRKKQIEDQIRAELGNEYEKFISLKRDLDLDKELLTDIAISTLMKGETVKVEDSEKNVYEPIFSVKFKKANVVEKRQ